MKQGYGFTEFENLKEFENWLSKQKVSRHISRLQVHHMYAPSYANWATDNALRRQHNTKYYHMHTNGWADIAQHFSIFPDGHIVTGRSLNSTPVGIKGWNTAAICIEIYGNFDKDEMKAEQKKAVIGCYALLAKKFNIPISAEGIRPHCWFTAGGAYIGDYNKSKSAKTCPGLKFFGGNTKASFEKNFYPAVRNYGKEEVVSEFKPYVAKVIYEGSDGLNVRKGPGTSYEVTTVIHHGEAYTIVEEKKGWGKLKSGVGWISLNSKYIQKI